MSKKVGKEIKEFEGHVQSCAPEVTNDRIIGYLS